MIPAGISGRMTEIVKHPRSGFVEKAGDFVIRWALNNHFKPMLTFYLGQEIVCLEELGWIIGIELNASNPDCFFIVAMRNRDAIEGVIHCSPSQVRHIPFNA